PTTTPRRSIFARYRSNEPVRSEFPIAVGIAIACVVGIFIGVTLLRGGTPSAVRPIQSDGVATYAKFEMISTGMTYEEVVEIIGGPGRELSRVEMRGLPKSVMYAWDGSGTLGAGMNATFQSGKLISKAQLGLK